jgi:uroporphyrinogen-III synthase
MSDLNSDENNLLAGKIFISTRPAGKSNELKKLLSSYGAHLLEMPTIEIHPVQLSIQEEALIKNMDQFQWLIFTSANGVSHFFDHLKELTGSYNLPSHTRIAVIGKKTGSKLSNYGHQPHYTNKGSTSIDFSAELKEFIGNNHPKVLLAVGNLARETIEQNLRNIAEVYRINIYNTDMPADIPANSIKMVMEDQYDMIIFTSPSSFHNFCRMAEGKIDMAKLRAASIGSITTEAMTSDGITPLVTADTMNSEGIVSAIVKSLSKPSTEERTKRK